MVRVVGVRFKKAGKVYYFDPAEYPISTGARVVVETARGVEYGEVAVGPKEVPEEQVVQPLKKVLRAGTERDAQVAAENKRKEKEAFGVAQKKIEAHGLDMNLVDVEYTFDGSKNIFYFTSEGRVDFRELVRDLAGVFRTRIEMRQIGVRDEAKLLGGIGPCGRILCCTSFLGDFAPVSIRMAKDQNLSLNPSKISGLCGRLMCCLRYEQETYEAAKKDPTLAPGYMPPVQLPADGALGEVEDLDERPQPRIGMRGTGESGFSARIAQAAGVTERPVREQSGEGRRRPEGDRPREEGRQAPRPGGGGPGPRPQGQPQRPQHGGPRRDAEARPQGEQRKGPQPQQGQDQRPPKQRAPQQPAIGGKPQGGPQQPRPQQQGPPQRRPNQPGARPQGERPQGDRSQQEAAPRNDRPQGEKPQGDRPPNRHRNRHRGNRPQGGERPEGQPVPNPKS